MGAAGYGQTRQGLHEMPKEITRMIITPVPLGDLGRAPVLFLPLFQSQSAADAVFFDAIPRGARRTLLAFAQKNFKGEEGEIKSFWSPAGAPERIVLFGLGAQDKWHERKEPLLARRMVRYAMSEKISAFATPLLFQTKSGIPNFVWNRSARAFAANALMGQFEYTKYKTRPKEGWPEVHTISLGVAKDKRGATRREIAEGIMIGEEVNAARDLANTPGSDMTPALLAAAAVKAGKAAGVQVSILDERQMKRLGMGAVLGVARGSTEKPRFIIMEYSGGQKKNRSRTRSLRGEQKPLVLVGKGVTFDTGGINLKPEQYMYEMHMDMSGGAAVIHGIAAIARLKLPINVVGLVPAVENMPSGSSYRPGDQLKSMSGKTIEVLNTDAEGRVILADALHYALRYKPGLIADFATLTGAAHVALGNYCSALFTNREDMTEKLMEIGNRSGDAVWPLPLWDEYLPEIKGVFGDIANMAKNDRYGGAIHGAKFLEQFVEDTPWLHLDIAPRMTTVTSDHLAKGASGVGVRYIVELAREYPRLLGQK